MKSGLICTIRESKGIRYIAACGQLKEKKQMGILEISLLIFIAIVVIVNRCRILYTKQKEEEK